MPLNFADPFERLGGAVGAAGGGGLTGILSRLLEPLDYVRQAAWNLVKKPVDALTEGDPSHLLGMIPGLAGLAGAVVGGPWGGALGAGLAQGIGKAAAPEKFEAPQVSDITGTEEFLPNLLIGGLTDPMTYMGGFGGHKLGAKVGREFGTGLEESARHLAPYKSAAADVEKAFTPEKWAQIQASRADPIAMLPFDQRGDTLAQHVDQLLRNPRAMGEFMPGSKYGGYGSENLTFFRPEQGGGGVTKFGRPIIPDVGFPEDTLKAMAQVPPTRLDFPEMLQASRSIPIAGEGSVMDPLVRHAMRVENEPLMQIGKYGRDELSERLMRTQLKGQGLNWWDYKPPNMGFDPATGVPYVTDPGSVSGLRQTLEGQQAVPRVSELPGQAPGWFKTKLLEWLGAREQLQQEIAENIGKVRGGNPLSPTGYVAEGVAPEVGSSALKTTSKPPGRGAAENVARQGLRSGVNPDVQELLSKFGMDAKNMSPSEIDAAMSKLGMQIGERPLSGSPLPPSSSGLPKGWTPDSGPPSPVRSSEADVAERMLREQMGLPPSQMSSNVSGISSPSPPGILELNSEWANAGRSSLPPIDPIKELEARIEGALKAGASSSSINPMMDELMALKAKLPGNIPTPSNPGGQAAPLGDMMEQILKDAIEKRGGWSPMGPGPAPGIPPGGYQVTPTPPPTARMPGPVRAPFETPAGPEVFGQLSNLLKGGIDPNEVIRRLDLLSPDMQREFINEILQLQGRAMFANRPLTPPPMTTPPR